MTFSEKLTFLLNLSGSSNAELARAVSIDPSQVSRLKNGTRNTPKRVRTIELMSEYFASRCTGDYQRAALAETVGENNLLRDHSTEYTAEVILNWLRSRYSDSSYRLDNFMKRFETYSGSAGRTGSVYRRDEAQPVHETTAYIYYGNEGRRAAVIDILDQLANYGEPCEVLIISDENLDWLMQETGYNNMMIDRILGLARRGYTVRRIVSSFRDSAMAIESLERWMPVYLTGALSTYYYPRLRDGVFRRFMIIAPGNFSLTSCAIGDQHECGATYVCYDKRAVEEDQRIFANYIDKCVPLNQTYIYEKNPVEFCRHLLEFYEREANGMSKWLGMSCCTVPTAIINEIEEENREGAGEEIIELFRGIQTNFENNLAKGRRYIEIIRLYTPEEIRSGTAKLAPSLLMPGKKQNYTIGTYRLQIMRILTLLEKYPNYCVVIDEGDMPECEMHIMENASALLVRTTAPFTIFNVTESNTVSACHEYFMLNATRYGASLVIQRRHTVEKLKVLYESLE